MLTMVVEVLWYFDDIIFGETSNTGGTTSVGPFDMGGFSARHINKWFCNVT